MIHPEKWPQGVVDYLKSDEALKKLVADPRFSEVATGWSDTTIDWLRPRFDVSIDPETAEMTISFRETDRYVAIRTLLFIGDQISGTVPWRSNLPDVSRYYKWSPREVWILRTDTPTVSREPLDVL
ncbi:MAG: hypothetical protein NVSMB14_03860 [Isosphaeraceae bacterium]